MQVTKNETVTTHSLGFIGQGSVNLENGTLKLEVEDFGWEGTRMPMSIKHLYHSNEANSDSELGDGWTLNILGRITEKRFEYEGVEYEGFAFEREEETIYFKCSDKTTGNEMNPFYFLYEAVTDSDIIYDPVNRCIEMYHSYYRFDENGFL